MEKSETIRQLREKIMALEGYPAPKQGSGLPFGLGPVEAAFPGNTFPVGVVHEFISPDATAAASTNGFIAALLGTLMQRGGFCLWVSNRRMLFPPGLKRFGVEPDRFLFIDAMREKDVLWAVEQGLKCDALAAVVGELREIGFAESQRLQLAVERSKTTGFLHRCQPRAEHALACATRWKISPMASEPEDGMPGVGFPTWRTELVKVRNGRPGVWQLKWTDSGFRHTPIDQVSIGQASPERGRHYA